jgi:ABC-type amino acid transport substrate-binding protein
MTPKEKAEELVDKFYYIPNSQGIFMMQDYQAKECALIAVDEIILEMNSVMLPNPFKQYWQEVKQEIEKL